MRRDECAENGHGKTKCIITPGPLGRDKDESDDSFLELSKALSIGGIREKRDHFLIYIKDNNL